MRPLLLDLFCGAGGAARGYMDAGFRVVGVDIDAVYGDGGGVGAVVVFAVAPSPHSSPVLHMRRLHNRETGSIAEWRDAMGVPWMKTRHEIAESIPPSYAEYVGTQLLAQLEAAA